jgi:teichoic acid transport system ATP-binding protein
VSSREPAIIANDVGVEYNLRLSRHRTIRRALGEWVVRRDNRVPDTFWALRGVSLQLNEGDVLGVVGRNGSGKSTLLLTLAGIVRPDEGAVRTFRKTTTLLSLGAGFDLTLTGRDNVYLNGAFFGLSKREIDERMDRIIAFSELGTFVDVPLRKYSSGMRSRLAFSIAAHIEPDVLMLDEVLGVGDEAFREKSKKKMKDLVARAKAIVVVSHSMTFIREMCTTVVWLEDGRLVDQGSPADIVKRYTARVRELRSPVRSVT